MTTVKLGRIGWFYVNRRAESSKSYMLDTTVREHDSEARHIVIMSLMHQQWGPFASVVERLPQKAPYVL